VWRVDKVSGSIPGLKRSKGMKRPLIHLAAVMFVFAINTIALCDEGSVLNLTEYKDESSIKSHQGEIVRVKLMGKINHTGYPDYHATVSGVKVWVAEYPF
jgi:hypothetical protein